MEKKRFCFILYSKFRQNYQKERAVKKRLGLSYIHSRQGTIDIRSRRGSGLFISGKAFGDASNKINCTSSCAFLCPNGNSHPDWNWVTKGTCVTHTLYIIRRKDKTMCHVGNMIKAELDRHPKAHTVTWFAAQLHCDRTNVYDIFRRQSIDTELLTRISKILGHDFFLDLSHEMTGAGR